MDTPFLIVNIYLIAGIFSIIVSIRAAARKNPEPLSWAIPLFSFCLIGIFFGYWEWFRTFSALYGIKWAGGG